MQASIDPTRRAVLRGLLGAALLPASSLIAASSDAESLHKLAAAKGISFGSEIGLEALNDPRNTRLIDHECTILVAQNEFKLYSILATGEKQYSFTAGDQIARFATSHGKLLRGHNLIWMNDEVAPPWLLSKDFGAHPRVTAEAFIREYIHEVTSHFGRAVTSWDVVNEAIDVGTGELRSCVFTRILGRDAVRIAFEAAREGSPHAQLVYNDYMDWRSDREAHRQGVLALLRWLQEKRVPIDTLGIESHIKTPQTPFDPDRWHVFLEGAAAMGLSMAVTEFDLNDQLAPGTPEQRDRLAAQTAKLYLDQVLSFKAVKTLMLWGLCDKYSYLRDSRARADGTLVRPNPYDDTYRPKLLRKSIARALKEAPVRT